MSNRPLWIHVVTDTRDDVVPFDRKLWNAMFNEPQYHSICARGDGRIIVFFRDHLPVLTVVSEDTLHDRLAELEGYYGDQVMGYAIEFGAGDTRLKTGEWSPPDDSRLLRQEFPNA